MRFEIAYSLKNLDRSTPEYFRKEALAEDDGETLREARRILRTLGDRHSVEVLSEILKIV